MTKEEYKEKLRDNFIQAMNIRNDLAKIRSEYIESNKTYSIGEKVIVRDVKGFERFAFVSGFEIDFRDNVVPTLRKSKKDGTQSEVRDRVWFEEEIIKIN